MQARASSEFRGVWFRDDDIKRKIRKIATSAVTEKAPSERRMSLRDEREVDCRASNLQWAWRSKPGAFKHIPNVGALCLHVRTSPNRCFPHMQRL